MKGLSLQTVEEQLIEKNRIIKWLTEFVDNEMNYNDFERLQNLTPIDFQKFNMINEDEKSLWITVKEINSIESLQFYLSKYPQGLFVTDISEHLKDFERVLQTKLPFITVRVDGGWKKEIVTRYSPSGIESVNAIQEDVTRILIKKFKGFKRKLVDKELLLIDRWTKLIVNTESDIDANSYVGKEWEAQIFDPKTQVKLEGKIIARTTIDEQIKIRKEFNQMYPEAKDLIVKNINQIQELESQSIQTKLDDIEVDNNQKKRALKGDLISKYITQTGFKLLFWILSLSLILIFVSIFYKNLHLEIDYNKSSENPIQLIFNLIMILVGFGQVIISFDEVISFGKNKKYQITKRFSYLTSLIFFSSVILLLLWIREDLFKLIGPLQELGVGIGFLFLFVGSLMTFFKKFFTWSFKFTKRS